MLQQRVLSKPKGDTVRRSKATHVEGLLAVPGKHIGVELPLMLGGVLPLIGLGAGDLADEVLAQNGPALGLLDQLLCRGGHVSCDDSVERPRVAEPASDCARVHIRNACTYAWVVRGRAGAQRDAFTMSFGMIAVGTEAKPLGVLLIRATYFVQYTQWSMHSASLNLQLFIVEAQELSISCHR